MNQNEETQDFFSEIEKEAQIRKKTTSSKKKNSIEKKTT